MLRRTSMRLLLVTLIAIGLSGCSGKDSPTTSEADLELRFETFAHFSDGAVTLFKTTRDIYPHGEPYVYEEVIIGEPFTDVNGDGVYERGIDIFIRSQDSTNQDLSHNGRHDGPDDPWVNGVPFDDLDGSGSPIQYESQYGIPPYQKGLPFCDLNKNGTYDHYLSLYYWELAQSRIMLNDNGSKTIAWVGMDSVFCFWSDGSIPYYMPDTRMDDYLVEEPLFILDDGGLWYEGDQHQYVVLERGDIDTVGFKIRLTENGTSFKWKAEILDAFEAYDRSYNNVLRIVCSEFGINDPDSLPYQRDQIYSFYFTADHGLVAVRPIDYITAINQKLIGIEVLSDTLPAPMSQESPDY